jgi:aryl-alcohol dehydrogenase-like predicted oxidoreductase
VKQGITYFDTARAYGEAERLIGAAGITKMPGVVVGTKCGKFLKKESDLHGSEAEKKIREEIDTSRTLLQLDQLPLVQVHLERPEFVEFRKLVEIMRKLKKEGKVAHVGVATRGQDAPLAAMKTGFFETIQVAYSILDQRMAATVLPQAEAQNVGVINRSVLLQGALTPKVEKLPKQLNRLKQHSREAQRIAARLDISLPTLAVRFALSRSGSGLATILIGTAKTHNLESAIEAVNQGPLPAEIVDRLRHVAIEDPAQVDPAQWPPSK